MSDDLHAISHQERRKLVRLVNTYLAIMETWYFHKNMSYGSLEADADKSGWWFDWDPVIRDCFPEVLVVMSGDRREERRFPAYAVIPRASDWIELPSNPTQLETLARDIEPESSSGDQMMKLIEELRLLTPTLPTERVGEVMKHLNALKRVIQPVA